MASRGIKVPVLHSSRKRGEKGGDNKAYKEDWKR